MDQYMIEMRSTFCVFETISFSDKVTFKVLMKLALILVILHNDSANPGTVSLLDQWSMKMKRVKCKGLKVNLRSAN